MAVEIERKFLVRGEGWRQPEPTRISQGYLSRDPERTVRVRIAGERAFLTIKGKTEGARRSEFEFPIPVAEARELLALCTAPVIDKRRHVLVHEGTRWEVDEFLGAQAGLVIAEVELEREDQPFVRPDWLADEVTGDPRYYNSNIGV